MQVIENIKLKEKVYKEKLKNGLTVMIIPKKGIQKKYIIWGTNYGSNDNEFFVLGDKENTKVPNGVAHFLEHKMFEQRNGTNSLDVLTALGVNANAYTTNDHTAYLYECTNNFYEALDEFMDYVQNPYFTDENVEKEKGIIAQEIGMYDDSPDWQVYLNCMKAMYHNNPIKIDIAGTVESISKIDKEILYKCYNSFYHPSNMVMVVTGDFEPNEILEEIKNRLIWKNDSVNVKRIIEKEEDTVVEHKVVKQQNVSKPIFTIGIKDKVNEKNMAKKDVSIEILLNLLLGKSSELYKELYEEGIIFGIPSFDYEFGRNYAHILISGQSNNPEEFEKRLKAKIKELKNTGINEKDFSRIKKKIYGAYVREFDDVQDIARMFISDYFKGINSFDYLEEIESINVEYLEQLLKDVFKEEKIVISIVKN